MQEAATLQLHMDAPDRPAVRALTAAALFAALLLALGELFGAPFDVPALLLGAAVASACALLPRRGAFAALLLALLGAVAAVLWTDAVREGGMALANRLFDRSEAVNAYAYARFETAEDGGTAIRAALLAAAIPCGALCAVACRARGAAAALLLGVVFTEAYFGVTPAPWRNLLLFAALAFAPARKGADRTGGASLLAAATVLALAVFLLAPRPNAAVEAYSERLRDELGAAAMGMTRTAPAPEEEANRVRQESRQHEELAETDPAAEQTRRELEKQTEAERELSLPRRIDYLRVALLLLAAVALLLAPFLIFLPLDRAKRLAERRRETFDDADDAAAIRAMFAHTVAWLRANGLETENRPLAQCVPAVETLTSAEYAARYAEAASIWREAAYSGHAMSDKQRQTVRELMRETERMLYARADLRARLRLRYVDCLCEV